MNKKQLQESIMSGVKRAFRTNKSLNESFSSWAETNIRKFDWKDFNDKTNALLSQLFKFAKEGYITLIKFVKYTKNSGWEIISYATQEKIQDNSINVDTLIQDASYKITKQCNDKLNVIADYTDSAAISIDVDINSDLMRFIDSTLDPNGKVKDCSAIVINKSQKLATENIVRVYITIPEFMSEYDKIIEYFS